ASHHALQHTAEGGRGLLADDLAHLLHLVVVGAVAVVVAHRLHHVGLQQMAAVDHRGKCSGHLNGGNLKGLTEGGGGHGSLTVDAGEKVLAAGPEDTGSLAK